MTSDLPIPWPTSSDLRVLRALCADPKIARSELLRRSGEAHSVIAAMELARSEWFAQIGSTLTASERAFEVLKQADDLRRCSLSEDEHVRLYKVAIAERPGVARELDQVHATPLSVVRRARKLVEDGQVFGGLVLLGDDDLTSVAISVLPQAIRIPLTVVEIDSRIAAFVRERVPHARVFEHDLREALPADVGSARVVASDPPYAPEGFGLFASRAAQTVEPNDGYFYVSFGWSGRATERGLAKQSLLTECGFLVEEVCPRFTTYDGAETLGATSALWVCRATPKLRAAFLGDKDLYTRRKPRRSR